MTILFIQILIVLLLVFLMGWWFVTKMIDLLKAKDNDDLIYQCKEANKNEIL